MDDASFREQVEAHGAAIVAGDMNRALEDFSDELKPGVPDMAQHLPQPVRAADILSVDGNGEQFQVKIRYSGDGPSLTVATTWEERDGRPLIIVATPV